MNAVFPRYVDRGNTMMYKPRTLSVRATRQGELRTTITIVWILLAWSIRIQAQHVRPVSGELRYEHQYQDVRVGDRLTTILRMNPSLDLNVSGNVYSPGILFYTLRTSVNTNFGSTHVPEDHFTNRQFLWNTYNANLYFLQFAPVNFELSARDYLSESKFSYGILNSIVINRQDEQRASISLARVPYVPVTHFTYQRTRSRAVSGDLSEAVTNSYTFSASSGSGSTGSLSLTGSAIDISDRFTGLDEHIFNVQLDGSRQLSPAHNLTVGSEYSRYNNYRGLSGGVGYNGALSDQVRIASGLSGKSFTSGRTSTRAFSASQNLAVYHSQDFSYGLYVNGGLGTDDLLIGRTRNRISSSNWTTGGNVQYGTSVGFGQMMTNLSMSYGNRSYLDRSSFWNSGFSTNLQTNIGSFAVMTSYGFTSQYMFDGVDWFVFGNTARMTATGMLPLRIRSQSSVDYRDIHDGGSIQTTRSDRSLGANQSFDGSFFYHIPFTLGLHGNVTWYLSRFRGHTYSWQFTFNSPRFFLTGLFFGYSFSRSYDPYFRRQNTQHNLNASYRWRAVSFSLRLRQVEYVSTMRDVSFTVSRPF
jgi:hypothetical protein